MAFNHTSYIQSFLANPGYNDAYPYGVFIKHAALVPGQVYYRCIGVHHLSGSENGGKNNVYLDVVDEQGKRIGPPWPLVDWTWEGKQPHERAGIVVLDKPNEEPGGNISLGKAQIATIWVAGRASDVVTGLQTAGVEGLPEEPGNHRFHNSFYLVFQRTVAGSEPEPVEEPPKEEEPTEPGPVKNWRIYFNDRELKEIDFCQLYARDFGHGTDGHTIRLIVARLAGLLDG